MYRPFSGKLGFFNMEFIKYVNKKLEISNSGENLTVIRIEQIVDTISKYVETPALMSKLCLMVPQIELIPSKMFFLKTFHWNIWISIIILMFIFAFSMLIFFKIDKFQSFFKSLTITFYSHTNPSFKNLNLKQIYLIISFWIYGHIILNNLNAKLYSFLTIK